MFDKIFDFIEDAACMEPEEWMPILAASLVTNFVLAYLLVIA